MNIIAAIATGASPAAIGIVRISGPGCFSLCDAVFRPVNSRPFDRQQPRKLVYGEMLDRQGQVIDQGLAVRFPGPRSYTGEDSAEFHCHGSPVVLQELLAALFAAGARQARPGEFSRRAFLNGRLDLTQAEAVADLIAAETAAAARNAAAQLEGSLRRDFEAIYNALLDLSSQFYAVVDYPDEDIEDIGSAAIAGVLEQSDAALTRLLSTCERGRVLKHGVRTAIVGRPNAGKSSLLNALAGYDRCLVTDLPGTTRDTVEESVLCGGVLLRLIDTAGLRETEDTVEKLGVARARQAAASADLVLALVDGSGPPAQEDGEVLALAAQCPRWIAVYTKKDLAPAGLPPDAPPAYAPPATVVFLSSVTGEGLDRLEQAVAALFPAGDTPAGGVLTNDRQQEAARRARAALRQGRAALAAGLTPDAILTDVEEALSALGELTGKTAREEIVSRIFQRFCVGK